MKILLTGGGGVVGRAVIPRLLGRRHRIRLLARGAAQAVREWPEGVEPYAADVVHPAELNGAVEGCDLVLHVAGIVEEKPPDVTYRKVNVEGTRHVVREAERSCSPPLVFLSSLGAERGASAYHRSMLAAERIVREYRGAWLILRPGNVYGPGDEVISLLLTMVRTLPVVPVIGAGDQPFQPLWYEDLGTAVARAIARPELACRVLELAGPDVTSMHGLLDELERLTGRRPARLPLPSALVSLGAILAGALGVETPVNEAKVTMRLEGNVLDPADNALITVLGVRPTRLARGLALLADALPEQTPAGGVGDLERKRFWADIRGSRLDAPQLLEHFRRHGAELLPVDLEAEPGAPREIRQGTTLTMRLPLRGHAQVRVEEATAERITFATVRGHPLAGAIRFSTEPLAGGAVHFRVTIYARPAGLADWIAMHTVGDPLQDSAWVTLVERMVALSGGSAPRGVQADRQPVSESLAGQLDGWILERIADRHAEAARTARPAAPRRRTTRRAPSPGRASPGPSTA